MSMIAVLVHAAALLAVVAGPSLQTSQPRAPSPVSTDHLKLRAISGQSPVGPGGRFSLVLEIEPRPRMHVYAPGAADNRIITLTVASQPFVKLLPVRYPESEIYVFEPLNERIPVYQKPFKLVQDAVLEDTPAARAALDGKRQLTVTGTLEYQACDDRICFNPVSVPVSWTVTLTAAGATDRTPGGSS
jgi:hypothetical protein